MGAEEFEYARDRVWDLPHDLSNNEKLDLYKLYKFSKSIAYSSYKQATEGDCGGGRPGGWNLKGQLKWDSWNSIRGNDSLDF